MSVLSIVPMYCSKLNENAMTATCQHIKMKYINHKYVKEIPCGPEKRANNKKRLHATEKKKNEFTYITLDLLKVTKYLDKRTTKQKGHYKTSMEIFLI